MASTFYRRGALNARRTLRRPARQTVAGHPGQHDRKRESTPLLSHFLYRPKGTLGHDDAVLTRDRIAEEVAKEQASGRPKK